MNKKLMEMWDSAHEIPEGAFISAGTLLVQLDQDDYELGYYVAEESAPWQGSPQYSPVRSVDPLPDPNDTGHFRIEATSSAVRVHLGIGGYHSLTKIQARNLARKITEALNE